MGDLYHGEYPIDMTPAEARRELTMRPMPNGSKVCEACAGTGEPSPWEHDHYIWLRGEPIAVCGACRGAGKLGRFGSPLSAKKAHRALARMSDILGAHPNDDATCELGFWKPDHAGCPVCGPDGPCIDPDYERLIQWRKLPWWKRLFAQEPRP